MNLWSWLTGVDRRRRAVVASLCGLNGHRWAYVEPSILPSVNGDPAGTVVMHDYVCANCLRVERASAIEDYAFERVELVGRQARGIRKRAQEAWAAYPVIHGHGRVR